MGPRDGVWGQTASSSGWGVFGFASAVSGSTNGTRGQSLSTSGTGVLGLANAGSGNNIGVSGESTSPDGTGVLGLHSASSGTGPGVFGKTNSTSASAVGVLGRVNSASPGSFSAAVRGENLGTSASGIGVWGSQVGSGWGVYGTTSGGIGMYGRATAASGTNYAVYGQTSSPDGYAGYFLGGRNYFEGKVGIGTDAPFWPLDVHASGSIAIGVMTSGTIGVLSEASATTGAAVGVVGQSASSQGRGVYSKAFATSGTNYGVFGQSDSSSGYDFFADGAGTDYGSSSSIRWKSNVRNIDQPLDKIAQLRGVYFDWDKDHGGHHDVGMIAEEVGEVLPEIVNYEENGIDAIGRDYSKLTPLLVEAINELHGEVDQKESKIKELQARLTALETLVEQLVSNRNGGA